jgi:hypothetical protein
LKNAALSASAVIIKLTGDDREELEREGLERGGIGEREGEKGLLFVLALPRKHLARVLPAVAFPRIFSEERNSVAVNGARMQRPILSIDEL